MSNNLIPSEIIESKIYYIRGLKVMMDTDLAKLYNTKTYILNQSVKRNLDRFPSDFMFRLSGKEFEILKSQFVMSSSNWGGRRTLPYAFTEHGIAMLSSVLNSKEAIFVNIQIIRTFIYLREMINTHKDLAQKIISLESRYNEHDEQIQLIFQAIKQLIEAPASNDNQIGFRAD